MSRRYPRLDALVTLTERDRRAYDELLAGRLRLERIPNTTRPWAVRSRISRRGSHDRPGPGDGEGIDLRAQLAPRGLPAGSPRGDEQGPSGRQFRLPDGAGRRDRGPA